MLYHRNIYKTTSTDVWYNFFELLFDKLFVQHFTTELQVHIPILNIWFYLDGKQTRDPPGTMLYHEASGDV